MVRAERAGFKYLLSPEHHFLDEDSHTAGNFTEFAMRYTGQAVLDHAAWREAADTARIPVSPSE